MCGTYVCDMRAFSDQQHADAEARKPSKGKKQGKDIIIVNVAIVNIMINVRVKVCALYAGFEGSAAC